MTPDQITQLRKFIKNWQDEAGKYITKTKFEAVLVDVINTKCDSLLALLPCSTCGGTKLVDLAGTGFHKYANGIGDPPKLFPCPDCK